MSTVQQLTNTIALNKRSFRIGRLVRETECLMKEQPCFNWKGRFSLPFKAGYCSAVSKEEGIDTRAKFEEGEVTYVWAYPG